MKIKPRESPPQVPEPGENCAEYTGHSPTMLERIATACGVALKHHAEKRPNFGREVALK